MVAEVVFAFDIVFVLVLVAVLAFSASAKNITKEAEFSMASGGDLCQEGIDHR